VTDQAGQVGAGAGGGDPAVADDRDMVTMSGQSPVTVSGQPPVTVWAGTTISATRTPTSRIEAARAGMSRPASRMLSS